MTERFFGRNIATRVKDSNWNAGAAASVNASCPGGPFDGGYTAIIDPDGLFGGDRLRRCSNEAQLHWPRLFLASNGFARLELNYIKLIGRAYPNYLPPPSQVQVEGWLKEYVDRHLLFVYVSTDQVWGQWDTSAKLLPRFKTAGDRRSPVPPEPGFTEWKRKYLSEKERFPKSFGNISEAFRICVGIVEQARPLPAPQPNTNGAQIAECARRLYAAHPKKKNLALIPQVLRTAVNGTSNLQSRLIEIEECHTAWCKSSEWTKKDGQYAPKLDEWIADCGFTAWPPGHKNNQPTAITTYTPPTRPAE